MTKSVFLLAAMNFRPRSICLQSIGLAGFRDVIMHSSNAYYEWRFVQCTYSEYDAEKSVSKC